MPVRSHRRLPSNDQQLGEEVSFDNDNFRRIFAWWKFNHEVSRREACGEAGQHHRWHFDLPRLRRHSVSCSLENFPSYFVCEAFQVHSE